MVYTKQLFLEITTLTPITDEFLYKALHLNIKDSYIKIYKVDKITYKDV